MATGDQQDMADRVRAVLPDGWFPDDAPILSAVLAGCGNAWAWLYDMLAFVRLQARRLTASGAYLDMIAADFFGTFIRRRTSETDASLSARIGRELFREKGTRAGLIAALTDLTGRTPVVFEPAYPLDTGAYTTGGVGYGAGGGYGSLLLPFQFFLTAYRARGEGVASVAGWGNIAAGVTGMPGGYGVGAIEYANASMFTPPVTDTDIYNVINDVRPVATIAWTRIED